MFDRILVPTDGSETVVPAVKLGIELAHDYDATLHGLYIVEPPPSVAYAVIPPPRDDRRDALEQEGVHVTENLEKQADEQDIKAITTVREGVPRDEILAYVEENEIDLIVMGTHGRTGFKRVLIGSVTESVVHKSDIPVLTISD